MTRTLILMRHAKSSWDDPRLDDFDRPLNDRGRASATALGEWLVQQGLLPDEGLVSTAKRTVETWNLVSEAFATTVEARFSERLYHASADRLLSELQAVTGRTVLLIAHNPGIADFAARLVTEPPQHPRFDDYPTGATTIIAFPAGTWSDIRWHTGRVTDFVTPRDLLE